MEPSFLQSYLKAFHRMEGWFVFDAALMFMAYNQLIADRGILGDTLEIGVYHGLSAICVASLRGPGRKMYAIDLFEHARAEDCYGSGTSYRAAFEENMMSFFKRTDFVTVAAASGSLQSSEYPRSFSFCHVDGGHSPEETLKDLEFASELLLPGGLLALDDYFNPQQPGVCEGAFEFGRLHKGRLRPIAIGFNKVLFCKEPVPADLNAEFSNSFPRVPIVPVPGAMWGSRVYLFGNDFRGFFDLYASKPNCMVPLGAAGARATFEPRQTSLRPKPGQSVDLPVVVTNVSSEAFPNGVDVFGLSYHLLAEDGRVIQNDNERCWLQDALRPGEPREINLRIAVPKESGRYLLEIDMVWEGIMWFKDVGNPTCLVPMNVLG